MKITTEWLNTQNACKSGINWFSNQQETDPIKVLNKLIDDDKREWANWLICKLFNRKQRIQYAVFAAEQVIDIFEKKYPEDKRPRLSIEATKKCLEDDSLENRNASAAYDAYDAASAAAAYAADAAAAYADAAASAAAAAAYAAYAAAYAAAAAAYTTKKEMQIKILNYGIELLKGGA